MVRQAHGLHMTVPDLLRELAIEYRRRPLERLSIEPPDAQLDEMVEAFGRVPKTYRDMAVSNYADACVAELLRRPFSALRVTLACDACLNDGFWDLRWYTGLMSVCLVHECYLRARCPTCGGDRRIDDMVAWPYREGVALVHTVDGRLCGAGLEGDGPQPSDRDLAANRSAESLLAAPPDAANANAVVHAVRTVVLVRRQAVRHFDGEDEVTPVEATASSATTAAVAVATQPMATAGTDRTILAALRAAEDPRPFVLAPQCSGPAAELGKDLLRRALRFGAVMVLAKEQQVCVPEPGFFGNSRHVPAMVPREMFGQGVSPALLDEGRDRAGRVMAVAIVQAAGTHAWGAAAHRIEADERLAQAAHTWVARFAADGSAPRFWEEVARIRQELLTQAIDFRARRAMLERAMSTGGTGFARKAADAGVSELVLGRWLLYHWTLFPAMSGRLNFRPSLASWSRGAPELDARFGRARMWRFELGEILGGDVDAPDDGDS